MVGALLPILLAVTNASILWKLLSLITTSFTPILVVTSESMTPAFHRGHIIFLWNRQLWINPGDIPVVWFLDRDLSMVHRAIKIHWECHNCDEGKKVV